MQKERAYVSHAELQIVGGCGQSPSMDIRRHEHRPSIGVRKMSKGLGIQLAKARKKLYPTVDSLAYETFEEELEILNGGIKGEEE